MTFLFKSSKLITNSRLLTAFLPPKQTSTIEYECLPSFSSMQFAHIADIEDTIIVQSFSMRTGLDFQHEFICLYF